MKNKAPMIFLEETLQEVIDYLAEKKGKVGE